MQFSLRIKISNKLYEIKCISHFVYIFENLIFLLPYINFLSENESGYSYINKRKSSRYFLNFIVAAGRTFWMTPFVWTHPHPHT